MMSPVAAALVFGLAVGALGMGCGPSAALARASNTVTLASTAVGNADLVVSRAEADEPTAAVERSRAGHGRAVVRLEDAEEVLHFWREEGIGKVGWATMAPCLAASLDGLVLLLEAAGLEVPLELSQAVAVVTDVNGDQCPSEPRPTFPAEPSDGEASNAASTSGFEAPVEAADDGDTLKAGGAS